MFPWNKNNSARSTGSIMDLSSEMDTNDDDVVRQAAFTTPRCRQRAFTDGDLQHGRLSLNLSLPLPLRDQNERCPFLLEEKKTSPIEFAMTEQEDGEEELCECDNEEQCTHVSQKFCESPKLSQPPPTPTGQKSINYLGLGRTSSNPENLADRISVLLMCRLQQEEGQTCGRSSGRSEVEQEVAIAREARAVHAANAAPAVSMMEEDDVSPARMLHARHASKWKSWNAGLLGSLSASHVKRKLKEVSVGQPRKRNVPSTPSVSVPDCSAMDTNASDDLTSSDPFKRRRESD